MAIYTRTENLVPTHAKVTLSSEKNEYFLGENILVHFKLENTGGNTFKAGFGGDSVYYVSPDDPEKIRNSVVKILEDCKWICAKSFSMIWSGWKLVAYVRQISLIGNTG